MPHLQYLQGLNFTKNGIFMIQIFHKTLVQPAKNE